MNTYTKTNTDHIRVSHKTRQMIKLKAYIGIHKYHDHFKFDSDSFPIVMDTGASCAISMDIEDFIELDEHDTTINGLGALQVKGKGTLRWSMLNDENEQVDLIIKDALYAPKLPIRLANPRQILNKQHDHKRTKYTGNTESFTMHLNDYNLTTLYDTNTNLPIYYSAPNSKQYDAYLCHPTHGDNNSTVYAYTATLSNAQRELLQWHRRLGHRNMQDIQNYARLGHLPTTIANVPIPLCEACQYGKAHKRQSGDTPLANSNKPLKPGDLLHVDQAISTTPGKCLLHSGKPTKTHWNVMTIFKDHVSKKIFIEFQESTNAEETIKSKTRVETEAMQYGIKIRRYHADNGIFKSKDFMTDVASKHQTIDFCGVDAHHQNGIAERSIRTIIESA